MLGFRMHWNYSGSHNCLVQTIESTSFILFSPTLWIIKIKVAAPPWRHFGILGYLLEWWSSSWGRIERYCNKLHNVWYQNM